MIELISVSKIYKNGSAEYSALKGVNLYIEQGEFVAIMGTSGAGKTTLLNIIGCMDRMTTGQYIYDGMDISKYNNKQLHKFRKEHIGFVFQNFALMDNYTVYENIEMPLLARKVKKRKQIILDVMKEFNIEELAKKLPSNISGGEQQRCALARAIVADTPVILADEPTGSLDSKTGQEIMEYIKKLNDKGKTVIMITHDSDVANYADRIIRIEDGIIHE